MRLYHGTRRGFTRGGWLFPRSFHRGDGTTAPLKPGREETDESVDWVYVTESLDLAWAYAYAAVGRGRPKVLEVEPFSEVYRDPEHSPDMMAYRCESARVERVLTDPPFTEAEAAAGWIEE